MTAVSTEEYESLRLALQKLIVCGLSPNREEFAVNGIFSLHDFNLIQSLFYQMYLRNARKRIPRYENSTVTSWMHEANSGGFKLKDIATRSGYSPYKVAKCFLSCVHHHTGMIAFMEEPDTILNTNKRYSLLLFFIIVLPNPYSMYTALKLSSVVLKILYVQQLLISEKIVRGKSLRVTWKNV